MKKAAVVLYFVLFIFSLSIYSQRRNRYTPVVKVFQRVGPAIVNISTQVLVRSETPTDFDEFFFDYFNKYQRKVFKTHSLGSGVIIDPKGFIVTAEHVIKRASKITVVLGNKERFDAHVISSNEANDIALLKIDSSKSLPFVKLGNSSDIMTGEPAIALGNPFGLQNTVTTGVISAVNRALNINNKTNFEDFLQTDAAINPGNSGGALLNINGELIGINIAIYKEGQGLGFAIPINRVRNVLGSLLNYKKLKKIWLGINLEEKIYKTTSVLQVKKVDKNSPAYKAGIKKGDLIEFVNSEKIDTLFDFCKIIYLKNAGDRINLKINRQGHYKNINLKIKTYQIKSREEAIFRHLGIFPLQIYGRVFVQSVRRDSSADRIGILADDLVLGLGNYHVYTIEQLYTIMKNTNSGEVLSIVIFRNGRRLTGNLVKE